MKIQVKVVEEVTYELDVTPADFLMARAYFDSAEWFHDKVLTEGKIADLSRSWEKITNLEPEALEKFWERA